MGDPTRSELRALAARDPVLGRALKRVPAFPGFPNREQKVGSHFHSLARAITYQQLAVKAAATIHGRVCDLTPGRGFPKPPEILGLTDAKLRGAGLSRNKLLALRDLATKTESGELRLRSIGRESDEEVIRRLVSVRGIGEWTAQMFLMFRLGRLDVIAPGDLGLQEGLRKLDGLADRPGPADLEERAEVWRPLRSVASWVLWRVLEVEE